MSDIKQTIPPKHIAIIMDGNGRWAKERGLARFEGHVAGVEALRNLVREIGSFGVKALTVFAFSSENWLRPESEVRDLMGLIKDFIRSDLDDLHEAGVRIRVIGSRENVPHDVLELIDHAREKTLSNKTFELVVAFNYGGRDEIVRAAQKLGAQIANGKLTADKIDEECFSSALDTQGISDPELIIRTSGELRLSNFLLWQSAYSEFVFPDCYWPDFDTTQFEKALAEYFSRERRFGGLGEGTSK